MSVSDDVIVGGEGGGSEYMPIEAVIVSCNYSDFLEVSLPRNLPVFDHMVVVTKEEDTRTRNLCRKHAVRCVTTDEFHYKGHVFNKGRAIARGIQFLEKTGWIVHMDADIVLPNNARRLLHAADLDPKCIYGIDRINCRGAEAWKKLLASGYVQHQDSYRVSVPDGFPLMSRFIHPHEGWCPVGFFQMWSGSEDNWLGVNTRRYPDRHNTAARADVQHALQWDRRRRRLIPEIIAVHLESGDGKQGANWKGRTTPEFKPHEPTGSFH